MRITQTTRSITTPTTRSTTRSITGLIVGVAAAFTLGAAVTYAVSHTGKADEAALPNPATAVRTSFPGLVAANGEPSLPGLNTVKPEPGTVARVKGPFDERLTIDKLSFDGSKLAGRVTITSEVSDILELEALAGFYDSHGRLMGSNRFTYHLVEGTADHTGPPSEVKNFTIAVPAGLPHRAVSAAVGVPVLVNE